MIEKIRKYRLTFKTVEDGIKIIDFLINNGEHVFMDAEVRELKLREKKYSNNCVAFIGEPIGWMLTSVENTKETVKSPCISLRQYLRREKLNKLDTLDET